MKTTTCCLVALTAALLCSYTPVSTAGQAVILAKGTAIQKLAPGHFRLVLPDGRKVELRNFNAKAGLVGNCGVFDAAGRKVSAGMQCQFRGAPKPLIDPDPPMRPGVARPPSPNYVQIDDEVTWLPATLIFNEIAIIDPQPPGMAKPGWVDPLQKRSINPQPEPPGQLLDKAH